MADNVAITAGSGTTIGADDVGAGVLHQRVKPTWGADGTGTDVQVAQPLPVQNTLESSQISNLGAIITPKFVGINVGSSGDSALVAAVVGKKIRVLSYVLVADGTVAVKFESATTALTGPMALVAYSGVASGFCPVGHFETVANTVLNLNLTAAVGVRGHLVYVEVA